MTIVSISLNDKILQDIDTLQQELGFSGRSEIIRAGLRMLLEDQKEKSKLKGTINAVLLVMYEDKHAEEVSRIRHKYQEIIQTQIHNHTENCLEIFIVKGDAKKIKELVENFQTSKKVDLVKLIIP